MKELLTLIKNYSTKGNWLDLGSGPTSLFWATAFEYEINSVTLIDISPYPFEVISRIRKSKIFPFAYIEALNYLNKDIKFLEEFCDINWKYKVTNVFTDNFIQHKFKNITAMGLIGLASNFEQLSIFFKNIKNILDKNGVFIFSSWILNNDKDYYISERIKIDEIVLGKVLELNNLMLCEYEIILFKEPDENYSGLMCGVVKNA